MAVCFSQKKAFLNVLNTVEWRLSDAWKNFMYLNEAQHNIVVRRLLLLNLLIKIFMFTNAL